MAKRRRQHLSTKQWDYGSTAISIRVGCKSRPKQYRHLECTGPRDAQRFALLVDDETRHNPRDPLIIQVSGYQPWLGTIFSSCIEEHWSDVSELGREVQFANTMQFPETGTTTRSGATPWTFIVNEMNVPLVYYWSVGFDPPPSQEDGLPPIGSYGFRVGVWFCSHGACRMNPDTPVYIVFTRPSEIDDRIVYELMFPYLYKDEDFGRIHGDPEGIAWIFERLWDLLSDWQNIIRIIKLKLEEAEYNSHGRKLPVKFRTRTLHREVDRCYELKEYLQYQSRAFKKLQKLKDDVPKKDQKDPIWGELDDATDDLAQYDATIDSLKERFSNLLDLEFNMANATQADNSTFLSIVATIFLPVSYLASLFGITTVTWPVIWYVWAVIPVVVVSTVFVLAYAPLTKWFQKQWYPLEEAQVEFDQRDFSLLGQELPGAVDVPGGDRLTKARKARRQTLQPEPPPPAQPRSRANSRAPPRAD